MKTILITGGAGFVGSSLAIGLRREMPGARIVSFDNLKRRGSELNLPRLRRSGVEFVHGDVRNKEDFESLGQIDLILECSAEPSVLAGYTSSPNYLVNTNLGGTINCLEVARKHGAGMIFLSTSRVYPIASVNALRYREETTRFAIDDSQSTAGASGRGISEQFPLEGARSLYGATKLCSELMIREYAEMYSLRTIVNRCGVLTGPWQMGKIDQGVVVLWAAKHFFGGRLSYIGFGGEGKQVRDILHVDDLCRLVLHQIERIDDLAGRTFNVGGGPEVSVSLRELTSLCREHTGSTIPIASETADRPADIRVYLSDNSRVHAATQWRPEKDCPAIVDDICRWISRHKESLEPIFTDAHASG
jgi:CDP-paratose 2-epimerase